MGLDQYAYVRAQERKVKEASGEEYTTVDSGQEFYWRKHSRLQEFMDRLWRDKGNEQVFNCQNMELTEDDLLRLQEAINNRYADHPCEGGFFWGHQWQEEAVEAEREKDTEFVTAALEAVRSGERVLYSCWW
jgi:hypothetical protein